MGILFYEHTKSPAEIEFGDLVLTAEILRLKMNTKYFIQYILGGYINFKSFSIFQAIFKLDIM